jgi:aspartyl aminopeptidase
MVLDADASRERALRFVNFLTAAVTPFHAVAIGSTMLERAGFVRLDEARPWGGGAIAPAGKYFYTRADSTLVAFAVGGRYAPGGGFKVVGAHTDSPALKTKPLSKFGDGATEGCAQLSVQCYGGGLWHTWFDRDLGIGGLVLARGADGALSKRLVALHEPVLRVPSLAIHLQTAAEREAFAPNKETHLVPVLCLATATGGSGGGGGARAAAAAGEGSDPFGGAQEPELLRLIADRLGLAPAQIAAMDLTLFDCQPPALTGARGEFVCGGRLDNLASCFVALEALIDASAAAIASDPDVSVVALFDHEEVGSDSAAGAGGPVMAEAIARVGEALGVPAGGELKLRSLRSSFLISLDNAHAVHPNYRVSGVALRVVALRCVALRVVALRCVARCRVPLRRVARRCVVSVSLTACPACVPVLPCPALPCLRRSTKARTAPRWAAAA